MYVLVFFPPPSLSRAVSSIAWLISLCNKPSLVKAAHVDQISLCLSDKGYKRISCCVFSMTLPPLKFMHCKRSSMFFIFFLLLTHSYAEMQQVAALYSLQCQLYSPESSEAFSVSSSPRGRFSRCPQDSVDKRISKSGATGTWQGTATFFITIPR